MKSDKGKEMLTFTDWYYQDSKIMQSILDTQGIEIDAIRDKIKNILEQFYVDTATWGLDLWEKELNIQDTTGNYSERRNRIKLYLAKPVSVTPRFLTDLVNRYSEKKSAKIIEHNSECCFEIEVAADDKIDWDNINKSINLYKPAHLGFYTSLKIFLLTKIINTVKIINYLNANHNFWNLGTAEKVYWDGIWNFNNIIDFSGIKPDALYRERQTHLLSIKNLLMPVLYININYKIENKEQINSKCKQVISYSNKTENKINNKQKIYKKYQVSNINKNNVIQNRTANTKNCWDGSFCLDGSHILSGAYEIDKQMENICVFYSTKHGIIDEGSKEIL